LSDFTIKKLPFYWRIKNHKNSDTENIVDNFFSFSFDFDYDNLLLIQRRDKNTLSALNQVYKMESNIGYLQDHNVIAKPYGVDFINFIKFFLNTNKNIKNILEIGCGGCVVLKELDNLGYEVLGIDSSPFAYHEGKMKGIEVITDFFPSSKINKSFDLIFHVDVLEHIDNYVDFLSCQYESLNEGGYIIVNVPDATESLEIGDISLAMHQHLNYFTEQSITAVLQKAGFQAVSVVKSGYGGSLYAIGKKIKYSSKKIELNNTDIYDDFLRKAELNAKYFERYSLNILEDKDKSLAYYVPLRALPYISLMSTFKGFRFFDDTDHWHRNFFDGVDVPIENFNDLKIKPVSDIIIMSLTFGDRIKKKINCTFGNQINVLTLNELIIRACNHEK
jgi:2-polyprenyl-3-methyl-5-hydroxy-6-metoxy-1,4-benzoquinol methylase